MKSVAIVTMADSNFFELMTELINSISDFEERKNVAICVLDAGLKEDQLKFLNGKVDIIKKYEDVNYIEQDNLIETIKNIDIVVCCMNLTSDNHNYFNYELLSNIKKQALIFYFVIFNVYAF